MQCYFGEAVCTGLFRTDFCTDFLHGFSARMFCADFLHGFFARIFCADFLHRFFARFLARFSCADCLQELFVQMLHGFLHGLFWGVPKHLLGSAKISPRKSPEKFTMLWGHSGEGLGRQEGEVRLWPAWPGQSLRGLGGLGGADGESSHSGGLGPKLLKAGSKSCQAKEC